MIITTIITYGFYRLVKNKSGEIIKTIDLNYIDALDAQDLEKESLNMYKKLKFNTINIAEPGGLGGKLASLTLYAYQAKLFLYGVLYAELIILY